VPVATEVARALDAPLDVVVVRKLGVPFRAVEQPALPKVLDLTDERLRVVRLRAMHSCGRVGRVGLEPTT
jgi:putative phosphoribosyl transferase